MQNKLIENFKGINWDSKEVMECFSEDELDVFFKLKDEEQLCLFTKFVLDKELYFCLNNDIKENVFNIIIEGSSNPSYKILYFIVNGDFSNDFKKTVLLWLKQGVRTLDDIKTKLEWYSMYEEYREEILEELYMLERDFNDKHIKELV